MADLESMTPAERGLFSAAQKLFQNPDMKVRNNAKRLLKAADPTVNFPEIDLEDRLAAQEAANTERTKSLEHELLKERLERKQAEKRSELAAKGYDPERIEKIIVEYGCSYENAMKIADMEKQTSEGTAPDVQSGAHLGPTEIRPEKEWRGLSIDGLRRKSAELAHTMVDELRGRKKRA